MLTTAGAARSHGLGVGIDRARRRLGHRRGATAGAGGLAAAVPAARRRGAGGARRAMSSGPDHDRNECRRQSDDRGCGDEG